tara:strand:+ start:86 stop:460 length:375 start_codon:yes stop_codon:yes gene_type:complete
MVIIILFSNTLFSQSSFKEEIGYVLVMEIVFSLMSYLVTHSQIYGNIITGFFDLVMGLAGLENASLKELHIQSILHYSICAGFISKSIFNFCLTKRYNKKIQFWSNFIGYNVLVFSGYYVDTLN